MGVLKKFLIDYLTYTSAVSDALVLKKKDFHSINMYGIEGLNFHRQYVNKPFQVQVFYAPPNFIIPEHEHPNVDSYEVYIGGDVAFSHTGTWLRWDGKKYEFVNDLFVVNVKHNDIHGAYMGPEGGIFMSVQHWINDVDPSCVSEDYDGGALCNNHSDDWGLPYNKEMTPLDAAHKEIRAIMWEEIEHKSWECIKPNPSKFEGLPSPTQYFNK